MHETGLGWFMGWEHVWYVGTGWRKRLVVTFLAWLSASALSRAAAPLLGTSCSSLARYLCPMDLHSCKSLRHRPNGWREPGDSSGGSAQGLKQQLHAGRYAPPEGLVTPLQNRGRCAVRTGWHERAHPSPRGASGASQPAHPPWEISAWRSHPSVPMPYCWASGGM